ncbi:MAG: helix-turn-helix domain-containing protein [Pseudomonadota bacterium]
MIALHKNDRLAAPAQRRSYHLRPVRMVEAGQTLFREADEANHLFEVVSGSLRLTRLLETGRRQVVAFAHPGDVVGFPAYGLHHSDCETLTSATIMVHRSAALQNAADDPDLHRHLQSAALAEIAALQDHLLLMARKGARGKLASFLIHLADRHGRAHRDGVCVDLAMPRADIADYLCMSVETVSRSLTQLRQSGFIRLEGCQRIVVLDRAGLEEIAGAD